MVIFTYQLLTADLFHVPTLVVVASFAVFPTFSFWFKHGSSVGWDAPGYSYSCVSPVINEQNVYLRKVFIITQQTIQFYGNDTGNNQSMTLVSFNWKRMMDTNLIPSQK